MATGPSEEQIAELSALAQSDHDGPVVMLNLNRYREQAVYFTPPPEGDSPAVSGIEAYQRYGVVAFETFSRLGAEILWHALSGFTLVGTKDETFDEVIAVRYPTAQAFLDMAADPDFQAALVHRDAGLSKALIVCCGADGAGPVGTLDRRSGTRGGSTA